jgi:single-strand DNA-binding protein
MRINNVVFAGNLTRDPESRDVNGKAVAKFTIAYTEKFKSANGEPREETAFVDCEAWGKTAEIAIQYLTKGSEAGVVGKLRQENWEDKDGNRRSKIIIRVNDLILGARREGGDRQGDDGGERAPATRQVSRPAPARTDDDAPF